MSGKSKYSSNIVVSSMHHVLRKGRYAHDLKGVRQCDGIHV